MSSMLFIDDGDMASRHRKAYEQEDAMSSAGLRRVTPQSRGDDSSAPRPTAASPVGGRDGLFGAASSGTGGGEGHGSGVLKQASRVVLEDAGDRRPEERLFCDSFLELLAILVSGASGFADAATDRGAGTGFGRLRGHRARARLDSPVVHQ